MAASSTAAKSKSSKLSRVQHQAMRMMTGAMQSISISAMEIATGLQPMEDRQEIKILTQAAKLKRLQDHPMHERINQPTRGRLKRSNFLQHSRIPERRNPSYWTMCPNPVHQPRPSPLGNEDNSQECALKCQGLQTEAANLSQRGSHWRWSMSSSSTQKTSGPTPTQMVLQQKPPEMGEVACTSGTMMELHTSP